MKLYIYAKCSTCKDAVRFLEKTGKKFTAVEITKTPPTLDELKSMLAFQGGQIRKLFNTSGLLYKEMQLKDKLPNFTEDEALKLLTVQGMLVKRPFLLGKDFGLVGFNEQKWSEALA